MIDLVTALKPIFRFRTRKCVEVSKCCASTKRLLLPACQLTSWVLKCVPVLAACPLNAQDSKLLDLQTNKQNSELTQESSFWFASLLIPYPLQYNP